MDNNALSTDAMADVILKDWGTPESSMKLPSRFQIGDEVLF